MATIKSQLVLTDSMTAPLRSIYKAMNMVLNSFESMQRASGSAVDMKAWQGMREELAKGSAMLDALEKKTKKSGSAADVITSKFKQAASAIGSGLSVKNIIGLADTMTQTRARLTLITGDMGKTAALQDRIMESANRSRASYQTTADAVSKMGVMAKDAFSNADGTVNTDELITFTELINKQFTIAGTSAQGTESAMLQLTQAMASGVLRGEELNSIFEQAPTIIETIAGHLGVSVGEIRSMASEGKITAEVVKNAMLGSASKINEQFNKMPYTFAQVWTMIQNILLDSFGPLIQVVGSAAQWIYDNWSTLEPIFVGLAVAIAGMTLGWFIQSGAIATATAAAKTFFTTLLSNPFTWFAVVIGVVIALIYKWIQSVGGIKNAFEICKTALIVAWNAIKLAFFTGIYWVIDLVDKLKLCWQKAGVAIANFMGDMKVKVLTILQNLINGAIGIINKFIDLINKIPGVNIGLIEEVTFATTAAAENEAAKQARAEDLAAYEQELAANKAGRDAHLNSLRTELTDSQNAWRTAVATGKAAAAANSESEQGASDTVSDIGSDTSNIADSAGSAASSLKETTEDLKYMRDLAEQEAINRFTTAEVKIDMTGMTNRIDSSMDLDGVLTVLTDGFAEALETAAEGVHV